MLYHVSQKSMTAWVVSMYIMCHSLLEPLELIGQVISVASLSLSSNPDMELDTTENIVANAEYHSNLLSTIAELAYVPQAIKDQIEYVNDLQSQIKASKKKIATLTEKTKKERKEHESLRDSTARRWAYFLAGKKEKFAARASKEERCDITRAQYRYAHDTQREYVEALESEMTAKENLATLGKMYDEGNRTVSKTSSQIFGRLFILPSSRA